MHQCGQLRPDSCPFGKICCILNRFVNPRLRNFARGGGFPGGARISPLGPFRYTAFLLRRAPFTRVPANGGSRRPTAAPRSPRDAPPAPGSGVAAVPGRPRRGRSRPAPTKPFPGLSAIWSLDARPAPAPGGRPPCGSSLSLRSAAWPWMHAGTRRRSRFVLRALPSLPRDAGTRGSPGPSPPRSASRPAGLAGGGDPGGDRLRPASWSTRRLDLTPPGAGPAAALPAGARPGRKAATDLPGGAGGRSADRRRQRRGRDGLRDAFSTGTAFSTPTGS